MAHVTLTVSAGCHTSARTGSHVCAKVDILIFSKAFKFSQWYELKSQKDDICHPEIKQKNATAHPDDKVGQRRFIKHARHSNERCSKELTAVEYLTASDILNFSVRCVKLCRVALHHRTHRFMFHSPLLTLPGQNGRCRNKVKYS